MRRHYSKRRGTERSIRFLIKSVDQQAVVVLHRLRQSSLRVRTSRINSVRGHFRKFGIAIPIGAKRVVPHALRALETDAVPPFVHGVLREALAEIEALRAKTQAIHDELERHAKHMPRCAAPADSPWDLSFGRGPDMTC